MRSKFKWIFTLLLAFSLQLAFAQKTVTGTVSDDAGPLPSANVVVKETKAGVQTDIDGKYTIQVAAGQTLVFSFVGMTDKEVKVGAANTYSVTLVAGQMLGEVIVTGAMGIQRTQNAQTASQQVVKSAELNQAAQPNAVLALTGKVSGLQINQTNSAVNATTRIVLRAQKSISSDNQALVVIDGAISSANILQQLAPETIESMNVVKGAQGAALYGSAGVNGVIIVTTKKGSRNGDKMTISLNSTVDFSEVAYLPQRQTRYGQGWFGGHVSYENGGWGPEFDGSLVATGLPQPDGSYAMLPYSSRGSDNIKDFFQTGRIYQNQITLSSGDENGYLSFSANNLKNEFVVEKDELKRNTFQFKAGKRIGKWGFDGNVQYISQKVQQTSPDLYYDLLQTATNIDIERYRNAGNEGNYSYYVRNPYWVIDNVRTEQRSDIVTGIANVKYFFNKHINVSYLANVNLLTTRSIGYSNAYVDPYVELGQTQSTASSYNTSNTQARNYYGDLLLNFDYDLTDNLNLKVLLGNNVRDSQNTNTGVSGSNLAIPGFYNIGSVSSTINGSNAFNRTRSYAFFANVDLGYKDFLFLNLTGRNDVNSVLPKNNNSFFYPSAGLSFVASNAFAGMKDTKFNYLKVAANFTRVGNADLAAYDINRLYYRATGYPFDGVNSYVPNLLVTERASLIIDPNITPEFYNTYEFIVNTGFFDNRITLNASYFFGTNEDLITDISSSYASGAARFRTNLGQTSSKGFEVDLGVTPFKGDFTWDMRLSFSTAKTTVDEVTPFTDSANLYTPYGTYGVFAEKGDELYTLKGIAYQRDDQGRIIVNPTTGVPLQTDNAVKLGNTTPDYILGLNTSFSWKGLTLSATMDYRTGHVFYSGTKSALAFPGYLVDTAENGRTGFVMPNSSYLAPDGSYQPNTSIVTGGTTPVSYQNYITETWRDVDENFILDATAFKVRELSLSYNLPAKLLDNTGFNAVRFGVNARNPFIVLPKENRGYDDPEGSISNGNIVGLASGTSGSGNTQYPNTRTVGFSVNLTF